MAETIPFKEPASKRSLEFSRPAQAISRGKSSKSEISLHEKAMKDYVGRQQIEDPFANNYTLSIADRNFLFNPPLSFTSLMRLPKESSMLNQCITAMVTNTVGHGYFLEYIGPDGEREGKEATQEAENIRGLIDYPNDDQSLFDIFSKEKTDKETLGQGYLEVGRDEDGVITMLAHLPAHTMRIAPKGEELVDVVAYLPRMGESSEVKLKKRFRRFVQIMGTRKVFLRNLVTQGKLTLLPGR